MLYLFKKIINNCGGTLNIEKTVEKSDLLAYLINKGLFS